MGAIVGFVTVMGAEVIVCLLCGYNFRAVVAGLGAWLMGAGAVVFIAEYVDWKWRTPH